MPTFNEPYLEEALNTQKFALRSEGRDSMFSVCHIDDSFVNSIIVSKTSMAKWESQICRLKFGLLGGDTSLYGVSSHRLIDFDHYNEDEIIVALQQQNGDKQYVMAQLKLDRIPMEMWKAPLETEVDVGPYIEVSTIKPLENLTMVKGISVSGKRKVGSVLVSSRRVRLYMFEHEADSDEESMMDDSCDAEQAAGSDKENMG